jgi:hypothetical protein
MTILRLPIELFATLSKCIIQALRKMFELNYLNVKLYRYVEDGNDQRLQIKLLDFQECRYGVVLTDLPYFLYTSTEKTVRSKHQEMLENDYYNELFRVLEILQSKLTKEEYPFDALLADFKNLLEVGLITAAVFLPIIMAEKDDVPDHHHGGDISVQQFKDMANVVANSETAEKIKTRFADVVQEMINAGVI